MRYLDPLLGTSLNTILDTVSKTTQLCFGYVHEDVHVSEPLYGFDLSVYGPVRVRARELFPSRLMN